MALMLTQSCLLNSFWLLKLLTILCYSVKLYSGLMFEFENNLVLDFNNAMIFSSGSLRGRQKNGTFVKKYLLSIEYIHKKIQISSAWA